MSAPSTGTGLLILVLFLLPGAVYGLVYERLHGPIPGLDASMRILRAITVSTLLNGLYLIIYGRHIGEAYKALSVGTKAQTAQAMVDRASSFGILVVSQLFLLPACLAIAVYGLGETRFAGWSLLGAHNPAPTAWDRAFRGQAQPTLVRVLTKDGEWVGGGLDGGFATSWPAPKELWIPEAWQLDKTGAFIAERPGRSGVFVRCDEARVIEFVYDDPSTMGSSATTP